MKFDLHTIFSLGRVDGKTSIDLSDGGKDGWILPYEFWKWTLTRRVTSG